MCRIIKQKPDAANGRIYSVLVLLDPSTRKKLGNNTSITKHSVVASPTPWRNLKRGMMERVLKYPASPLAGAIKLSETCIAAATKLEFRTHYGI